VVHLEIVSASLGKAAPWLHYTWSLNMTDYSVVPLYFLATDEVGGQQLFQHMGKQDSKGSFTSHYIQSLYSGLHQGNHSSTDV
jgi:hypothetical protein